MSHVQPPNNTSSSESQGGFAAPVAPPQYAYMQNQPSDEIDLVELLGFFWKIKFEIAAGAILGVLVGLFVAFKVLPVTYRTQIPLVLDKNEVPSADVKKLVENFNNTLNVSGNARQVWRSVFNQSPEFARTLKENGLTDEALAARQTLADKPEKAPLRLRESASPRDFILDVQLPVKGLTPRAGELFASAIQSAFTATATQPELDKDTGAKPASGNAPSGTPLQMASFEETTEMREQLLKARQELLKIEYLCSKLGRGLPEFNSFVVSGDADSKTMQVNLATTSNPNEAPPPGPVDIYEQMAVQGQFERIQRMTSVLLAEARMKPEDATDTVGRAMQVRDDILQLIPVARREANRMSNVSLQRRMTGRGDMRSGMAAGLPVLVSANASGATLTLEEPISKRKIALVLGAFLGAFVGFAAGGLRVFVRKNGHRLREVLAQ